MRNIKFYIILIVLWVSYYAQGQSIGMGINLSQSIYQAGGPEQANFLIPSLGFSIAKNFKIKGNHHLVTGLDLLNFNTGMRTERDFGNGASAYLMTRPRVSVFHVPLAYEYRLNPSDKKINLLKFIRVGTGLQTLKTSGYASRTSLSGPNTPNINGTGNPYSASARILTSTMDNRIFGINPFLGIGGYYKLNNSKFIEVSASSTYINDVPDFSAFHVINSEINSIDGPKSAFLITFKINYFIK
jgi:hypothetical protein